MRSQHLGMSPHPGHHSGFNDTQLWQQHLLSKQLEELQRQQQLQQLDQGSRRMSVTAEQTGSGESPLLNGVLINNASNYSLQNSFGGELKTPSNCQMFGAGNMNWAQLAGIPVIHGYSTGLMLPNDQGQATQPVGFALQKNDSLHRMPTSSTRDFSIQYPHFQGMSPDSTNVMTKGYRASVQNESSNVMSINFQQVDHLQENIQPPRFEDRQEQADWSGILQEKADTQVGPSYGMAILDPTEEKLLFGTGYNNTWDASIGSWSALMQGAVLGSCDDKGLYEEQNCASFQKTMSSTGNHPALLNDNEKQQAKWDDNKSFKEAKTSQFDLSQKQKQFSNGGIQAQMLGSDATNDVLARNTCVPSVNIAQKWSEQNVPLSDVSQHNIKPNGWNINEPVTSDVENTSKFQYTNNQKQYAQRTDSKRAMQVENSCDGSMWNIGGNHVNLCGLEPESNTGSQHMWMEDTYIGNFAAVTNSNTEKIRQKVLDKNQVDYMKHIPDSLVMSEGDENVRKYQHQSNIGSKHLDSSPNSSGKGPGETSVKKQEHKASFSEYYTSNYPHLGQQIDNRNVVRDTSLLTGPGSYPSNSVGENPSGQAGRQAVAPRRFHHHPMGYLGMNVDPANSPTQTSYSQGLPKSVTGGLQNQEQGYTGSAPYAGRFVSNNVMSMGKGQHTNLQRSLQGEEMHLCHNSTASASFHGSTVQFTHNNRIIQTSQNMLELLHNMDRSRESNNVRHFSSLDNNMVPNIPGTSPANESTSHPQHNQSSMLQGFGLHLVPPSQQQLISNHILPSRAYLNDININQDDTEAGDRDQTRPTTVLFHSLPASRETFQKENSDTKFSKQARQSTSHSSAQVSSLQQAQQHISAPGHEVMDQPVNFPSGSQSKVNADVKHASLLGQSRDTYKQGVADKYFQTPLPSASGRIPPFKLPSSDHAPASLYDLANAGHYQPRDAGFYQLTNSGQQLFLGETRSVSTMPQLIPSQQRSSGVRPHKLTPNLLQSTLKSTNSRDTSSWALQKADDLTIHTNRLAHALPEFGASSSPKQLSGTEKIPVKEDFSQDTSSEQPNATPKNGAATEWQASALKHLIDGDSSVSIPSLAHLHQQENKGKGGPEHVPFPNIVSSSSGIASYGRTYEPSDTSLHKYSVLQQMQALKGSDTPRSECKAGQRFIYGQNTSFKTLLHDEHATTSNSSFPPDAKMRFSSKGNDETSVSTSSHHVYREVSSQDKYTSSQHHLQNHTHFLGISSTSNFIGGNQYPMVTQMGSFSEQYGDHKKGQILDTLDRQRSAKAANQQFLPPKVSEVLDKNILVDQRADSDQAGSFRPSTSPTTMADKESPPLHLVSDIMDEDMILRPKKRKSATPELLLWQKEVTQGSQRLHNIVSTAQLGWAQSTNRLAEVEDEAEMIDNCLSMPLSRRRVILTTHLMQQLLPSVPSAVIGAEASSAYETVAYFVAKKALGDSCSLISYSRSNSRFQLDSENTISKKVKTSEKVGDHILLKVVDDFMGRSRKLKIDLSRLKTRVSLLDLRMECEELERVSIINRLVKFHGRSHTEGVDSSSASKILPRRTFPQRYVTAFTMPGNQPEGLPCLLL